MVPFGLRGKQTLIFVGQQSKAPTTASFDTLPYTPSAQPSTYGGRPGTTLTFYAVGFARDEIVHAVIGRTRDAPGDEVSCPGPIRWVTPPLAGRTSYPPTLSQVSSSLP